jgi:glycosyltransferase involved in cell wall biosynthesis
MPRRRRGFFGWWQHGAAFLKSTMWFYARLSHRGIRLVRLNNAPNVHAPVLVAARLASVSCVAWLRSHPPERTDRRWRFVMSLPDRLVSVSESVRRAHIAAGIGADRMVTAYDGVTVASPPVEQENSSGGEANRPRRVGTLGRLVRSKGLMDFVNAAAVVLQTRKDVVFLIAGAEDPADPGLESELLRERARLGLAHHVTLVGFCDPPSEYLHSLDCFVQPSTTTEAFGMAIIEAMAAGCAVVATAAGGQAEILEDGISGLLVEPGDPQALAGAICRVLGDHQLRRQLQESARARLRARFALDVTTARQEAFFAEVVKR